MAEAASRDPILAEIGGVLEDGRVTEANLQAVLDKVLARFACVVGTIHCLNPDSGLLDLRAQRGLPEILVERTRAIPIGKGMAGLAAERRQAVQVCNLQTDESGVANPGAKETKMEGAVAVPMLVGDSLRGTIGVGKPDQYEFDAAETALLLQIGRVIGKYVTAPSQE